MAGEGGETIRARDFVFNKATGKVETEYSARQAVARNEAREDDFTPRIPVDVFEQFKTIDSKKARERSVRSAKVPILGEDEPDDEDRGGFELP